MIYISEKDDIEYGFIKFIFLKKRFIFCNKLRDNMINTLTRFFNLPGDLVFPG